MAGFLSAIGDALKAFTAKFDKAELRKAAVLSMAENNLIGLKGILETFNPKVAQYVQLEFIKTANPQANDLRVYYKTYISSLLGQPLVIEQQGFLTSIKEVAALCIAEHQVILDRFQELFPGQNTTMTIEETRVTQALVIGYLKSIETLLRWTMCMYSLIPHPGVQSRVPGYRISYLGHTTTQVAQVVQTILTRIKGRTILNDIDTIKKNGSDVFLKNGDSTIDHYAANSDYPQTAHAFMGGFSLAVIMIYIGDFFMSFGRWYYDYLKNMREWLATKITVLQMDMAKMDPNSPEYEKARKMLDAYSAKLTEYDQKIAKSEEG